MHDAIHFRGWFTDFGSRIARPTSGIVCLGLVCGFFSVASAAMPDVGEGVVTALQDKTILLAGATGKNGSHVLKHLHALGLDVRAMSRNADKARKEFGAEYQWVEADVTQPATLEAATEGVDIVISAVATMMPLGKNRSEKVDYEGTRNLASAAKSAGASRFVIITSSSSGVRDHFLNLIGNDVLIWKGKAEQVLVDSGLEYVVVGPAGIDDRPGAEEAIRLIPRAEYERGMFIGREDLAAVVIAAAGHPAAANRVFTATGSEAPASSDWLDSFQTLPTELNLPEE